MALNNQQYREIMAEYEHTRQKNQDISDRRKLEVYTKIPAYKELDLSVSTLAKNAILDRLNNTSSKADSIHTSLKEIRIKKENLLVENGFSKDYLDPVYDCPGCQDTGYILKPSGIREKCPCLKKKEFEISYSQSNIRNLIANNNFSNLSYDYYNGEDLLHFEKTVDACKDFVKKFETDYHNLFFYGTVGTGKSFLSCCIANEILSLGHSVIYYSSQALFEQLGYFTFSNDKKEELNSFYEDLYNCDLLIIDDLGTELTNNFVSSMLFSCLNERNLRNKPVIISSNLNLEELRNRYSDRVFSRITSNFDLYKLSGPDIRMYKKRTRSSSF